MTNNYLDDFVEKADNVLSNGEQLLLSYDDLKKLDCDWKKHVSYNQYAYNKILIKTSLFVNVFIICWKINQNTQFHDHDKLGCLVKILSGKIQENLMCVKTNIITTRILNRT